MTFSLGENRQIRTVPDLAYPFEKVAIFCDSKAYHLNIGRVIDDARRRNAMGIKGWLVLTYWGPQIVRYADGCAAEIGRALAARREQNLRQPDA